MPLNRYHTLLQVQRFRSKTLSRSSLRLNSTEHTPARDAQAARSEKPVSPHIGFYKMFGRPMAKVFLGAIFTYQSLYLLWTKLETDEEKEIKETEIANLERQLKTVQRHKGD